MPVVNTNTIKEWFRNLKKPTEDQFWTWLDSFRHKWEKVPLDDVEGLTKSLQKKADLVNGTVPESQLPFSVKTSEVLQIGQITATENTVTVQLHSSGKNRIRLNGVVYERTFANPFTYRAVINYSKILIVYTLPVVGLFFLAEGAEAPEAIEPELPEGAFVIRRIVVNQTGQIIEAPIADGLKYNEEDGWRNIMLTESLTVLPYSFDLRSSYWIDSKIGSAVIGGIRDSLIDRNASLSWDGKEFWIYNNTGEDLTLNSATVIEDDVFLFTSGIVLKHGHSCKVKIRRDALEIVGVLGGSEFDPASLIAADANLQAQISAEVVERAIQNAAEVTARQNADIAEANARTFADGILQTAIANEAAARATADSLKVDKPTADGTWMLKKVGSLFTWVAGVVENISNADLSNVSARIFTQGNTFTWNTNGFPYYLKGLLDKTGNSAYTKVLVVHPTSGEQVTRDFADPQATTLAVQNASTAQKTAMRTALLGTATPASPTISGANPNLVTKGVDTYVTLYGLNLTLLDPSFIYIKRADDTRINALQFFNQTTVSVLSLWNLPTDLPDGVYTIYIQNGVTVQGVSQGVLYVNSVALTSVKVLQNEWIKKLSKKADGTDATQTSAGNTYNIATDNFTRLITSSTNGVNTRVAWKSPNILPTGFNDIWIVEILISYGLGGSGTADPFPFIGITKTKDSEFDIPEDLNIFEGLHSGLSLGGRAQYLGSQYLGWGFSTGTVIPIKLVIEKPAGDKVYMKYIYDNGTTVQTMYYNSLPVTLNSNYALFMNMQAMNYQLWYSAEYTIRKLI